MVSGVFIPLQVVVVGRARSGSSSDPATTAVCPAARRDWGGLRQSWATQHIERHKATTRSCFHNKDVLNNQINCVISTDN